MPRTLRIFAFLVFAAVIPACGGGGGGGGAGGPGPVFAVTTSTPLPGTTGVAQTILIYVRFNAAVNPATIDETNFTIEAGGIPLAGTTVTVECGTIAVLDPGAILTGSTVFTVNLTSAIQSGSGVPLTPHTFLFTTNNTGDTTPPTFSGPTGISATLNGTTPTTAVDLTWNAASDGVTIPANLVYDIFTAPAGGCFTWDQPQQSVTGVTSATVNGLSPRTDHQFVVRARDEAGNRDANTDQDNQLTDTSLAVNVFAIVDAECNHCHKPGGGTGEALVPSMDMTNAMTLFTSWVGVAADGPNCGGMGETRVIIGDSANSLVFKKINTADPLNDPPIPPCGNGMPFDGPPWLNSIQIQTIVDWIDQGALNN